MVISVSSMSFDVLVKFHPSQGFKIMFCLLLVQKYIYSFPHSSCTTMYHFEVLKFAL